MHTDSKLNSLLAPEDLGLRDVTLRQSFSGAERNHLFMNEAGAAFTDVSGLCGADHIGDARAFALLDYNRDGWLDLAVINANAPKLQLFENRLAHAMEPLRSQGNMIALRFVGGNDTAGPAPDKSNRDGIGAAVELQLGGATIRREYRGGEGFAAQNSSTMLIGIGAHDQVDNLRVLWPSGQVQNVQDVRAGHLVKLYEDKDSSPSGSGFELQPYRVAFSPPVAASPAPREPLAIAQPEGAEAEARFRLYATMTPWCAVCREEIPQLESLREVFGPEELMLYVVEVDEEAPEQELAPTRISEDNPAYRLLKDLEQQEVELIKQTVLQWLGADAVPASILVDSQGGIVSTGWGVPSVSEMRLLLADSP